MQCTTHPDQQLIEETDGREWCPKCHQEHTRNQHTTYQTMTFNEQTKVLDHLHEARHVLRTSGCSKNLVNQDLQDHITKIFERVQKANTKTL